MTPTNEAITETEAGFGSGLRAQIARRRQVSRAELGRSDARVEPGEGSVAPPIEDSAFVTLRAPASIEADAFYAAPQIAALETLVEPDDQAHAVETESEHAFELFERERELSEREQSLAARQKDVESNAVRRSGELLAEREQLRIESDRLEAEAARVALLEARAAAAGTELERRHEELIALEREAGGRRDLDTLSEELAERETLASARERELEELARRLAERERDLDLREATRRDAEALLESERLRLERRKARLFAHEASLAEQARELDELQQTVDRRRAFLERDIDLRLEELERREQNIQEVELTALAAQAQTEPHPPESGFGWASR